MKFCSLRLLSDELRFLLALASGRVDELALCISGFPLPARLQTASELEAWEDVCFGIDDYRVEW